MPKRGPDKLPEISGTPNLTDKNIEASTAREFITACCPAGQAGIVEDPLKIEAALRKLSSADRIPPEVMDTLIEISIADSSRFPDSDLRQLCGDNSIYASQLLYALPSTDVANRLARMIEGRSPGQAVALIQQIDTMLKYAEANINYTSLLILGSFVVNPDRLPVGDPLGDFARANTKELFDKLKASPDRIIRDCPLDNDPDAMRAMLELDQLFDRLRGKKPSAH